MSRPPSLLNAFRAAFPRRPLSANARFGASPAGPSARSKPSGSSPNFGFTFGGARYASGGSASLYTASLKNTLLRPITLVLIFAPILTGYLGVWQVQRLKWKVALIEEVDRNLAKEPMALPGNINLSALPDFAFRRVLIKGRYTGPAILQGPQTREGVAGYHLIQPFDRSETGGSTILVNRGFIKTAEGDAIRTGEKPIPGMGPNNSPSKEVVVEGLLTRADPNAKSYFTPENKPDENRWYWKDVPAMAEDVGGAAANVQPVLIDVIDRNETPSSMLIREGIPVGRAPEIELRNQHMTYAITWFSLCAATTVMLGMVIAKGRNKKLAMPQRRAFDEHKR